jgi:hypothetical protein
MIVDNNYLVPQGQENIYIFVAKTGFHGTKSIKKNLWILSLGKSLHSLRLYGIQI